MNQLVVFVLLKPFSRDLRSLLLFTSTCVIFLSMQYMSTPQAPNNIIVFVILGRVLKLDYIILPYINKLHVQVGEKICTNVSPG